MADKKDIDFTYTSLDRIFRLSIGDMADFSGAMYNGDFSLSLDEAQAVKHRFMADQLRIGPGKRVLDMGCGWGPFLNFIRSRGAVGVGLTLSEGQYLACRKNGLDVHICDVRTVKQQDFGIFDSVVSVGAFEHFCSFEEYRAGRQMDIYRSYFETVYNLLPAGGRFYLQTMAWGRNMIDVDELDRKPKENSDAYFIKLMADHFPGSWLPYGSEMIIEAAEPFFKMFNMSSGRLDYIETTRQWRRRIRRFTLPKYLLFLKMVPHFIMDPEFRAKLMVFRKKANQECFQRQIMDHFRMVFEKK